MWRIRILSRAPDNLRLRYVFAIARIWEPPILSDTQGAPTGAPLKRLVALSYSATTVIYSGMQSRVADFLRECP